MATDEVAPAAAAAPDAAAADEIDVKPDLVELQKSLQQKAKEKETPPKSKLVVNPAAVIVMKEKEKTDERPNYQTNRIIIPRPRAAAGKDDDKDRRSSNRNDRRRRSRDRRSKSPEKPAFSTKLFSIKSASATDEPEGLIGVEYVVKVVRDATKMPPRYECCLCEIELDGDAMQGHLTAFNHRLKFLQKHFPTALNNFKVQREDPEMATVMFRVFDRLAKAIESHHGRDLPYECDQKEYETNRFEIMSKVYSFRHASEYSGPSFLDVVDKSTLDQFIAEKLTYRNPRPDLKRRTHFDPSQDANRTTKRSRVEEERHIPYRRSDRFRSDYRPPRRPQVDKSGSTAADTHRSATATLDVEQHKALVEQFLANTSTKNSSSSSSRSTQRKRSRSRERVRPPPPAPPSRRERERERVRDSSISPLREGDIWQAYRHMYDRAIVTLDDDYKSYRRDPEKHPDYNAEWQQFWKRRKEDLAKIGVDYHTHDFQPEWVTYFGVRIKEMHDEAIEELKVKLRERLVLPMHNHELQRERYVKYRLKQPREGEMEDASRQREEHEDDDEVTPLSVLRLLTALEDDLGSLGARIVDLLGKALTIEKLSPQNANEVLLTMENCTLLETAREKLKGLLIAGMLEGPKVRAIKRVIGDITKLVGTANANRIEIPAATVVSFPVNQFNKPAAPNNYNKPVPKKPNLPRALQTESLSNALAEQMKTPAAAAAPPVPVVQPTINKKELATKLAAGLAAQGRTDIPASKVEQVVSLYTALQKRNCSDSSDKGQKSLSDTLAAFLGDMGPKESDDNVVEPSPQPPAEVMRQPERNQPSVGDRSNTWPQSNNAMDSSNSAMRNYSNFNADSGNLNNSLYAQRNVQNFPNQSNQSNMGQSGGVLNNIWNSNPAGGSGSRFTSSGLQQQMGNGMRDYNQYQNSSDMSGNRNFNFNNDTSNLNTSNDMFGRRSGGDFNSRDGDVGARNHSQNPSSGFAGDWVSGNPGMNQNRNNNPGQSGNNFGSNLGMNRNTSADQQQSADNFGRTMANSGMNQNSQYNRNTPGLSGDVFGSGMNRNISPGVHNRSGDNFGMNRNSSGDNFGGNFGQSGMNRNIQQGGNNLGQSVMNQNSLGGVQNRNIQGGNFGMSQNNQVQQQQNRNNSGQPVDNFGMNRNNQGQQNRNNQADNFGGNLAINRAMTSGQFDPRNNPRQTGHPGQTGPNQMNLQHGGGGGGVGAGNRGQQQPNNSMNMNQQNRNNNSGQNQRQMGGPRNQGGNPTPSNLLNMTTSIPQVEGNQQQQQQNSQQMNSKNYNKKKGKMPTNNKPWF